MAPAAFVPLAADLGEMDASPAPAKRAPLVYVGSALGIETKRNLVAMLREAAATDRGLELWGSGWGEVGPEDLRPFYRGILPHGELASCYAGAGAVLGATMDGQRDAGMVNNRVFEALARRRRPSAHIIFRAAARCHADSPWRRVAAAPRPPRG